MARIPVRLGLLLTALLCCPASTASADSPIVLILYSDGLLTPASADFTNGLRDGVKASSVQIEAQHLDLSRFVGEAHDRALADWLTSRHRDRPIAVVVPLGVPASVFASRFGPAIWPQARIVHAAIDGEQLNAVLKRGEPAVPRVIEYRRTLEAALALFPESRRVSLIAGASPQDRRWLDQAEADLAPLVNRIRIDRIAGLRWQEVLDRVSHLPDDAVAIWVNFFVDADARTVVIADAFPEVVRLANRPIFVTYVSLFGSGAVGGAIMDAAQMGRQTSDIVLSLLGNPNAAPPPQRNVHSQFMFDAAQLRRWNVSERNLPPGSLLVNREHSLWDRYYGYVVGASALLLAQSALIGALLVQRLRRRRVEAALRESETLFRSMADTAPVMIWRSTPDMRCDFFNLPWLTFTGRPLEQELGDGWADSVHKDDFDRCLHIYRTAFAAREPFRMEYRLRRFDGEYRWVLDTGIPRLEADGGFSGYIGSCIDITDRRQAELALHDAHLELARVSRLTWLGEFAASVAHEVRQPLTSIMMNARSGLQYLGGASPDLAEVRAALLDVVDAGDRAGKIIQRNHELFRDHTVQKAPVDINDVIREVAALSGSRLESRGCALATSLGARVPPVLGDRVQLQQVLWNLLVNSIDAVEGNETGSRRIEITSGVAAGDSVQIAVRDNGVGVEHVDMRRMFMPSYTTKPNGMGMGLSISRSIVEAHGGQLWAEQNTDRGATLFLMLPAEIVLPPEDGVTNRTEKSMIREMPITRA